MTPDEVVQLQEGDEVTARLAPDYRIRRGKVTQTLTDFVRIDWVSPFKSTYDILRRTSPLWVVIEREPKP